MLDFFLFFGLISQVFACGEETFNKWWAFLLGSGPDQDAEREKVKKDRLAVAEVLLRAGAVGDALFHDEHDRDQKVVLQEDIMQAFAEMNPHTGGPEVLELLSKNDVQPRSLRSTCRLVIRRCLSRPICLHGNIKTLQLPFQSKSYVAMDRLDSLV